MSLSKEFNLVVAGIGADGRTSFIEPGAPATMSTPGVVDLVWMWAVEGGHSVPHQIGAAPSIGRMPGPDGSAFGVVRFPARSAGKLDVSDLLPDSSEAGQEGNVAMHATDTIDYEIILSGKIDIVLPGNQRRTLKPGDLLVMGGVPHAWENVYDEDCTYVFITIGAKRGRA
jgi:hypothetical protein